MSETPERYWDAQAADFDREADHGLLDPSVRAAWVSLLAEHLPAAPATVLDLGCGTGTLSVLLARGGYDVHGLDFSAEMVAAAERKSQAAGVSVSFTRADASLPPYDPGSADVVLARHVLWALPDPVHALRRWVELLRPEGRLVLIEGCWSTGSGLTADAVRDLVMTCRRKAIVQVLDNPDLWGRLVADERFLVVSFS